MNLSEESDELKKIIDSTVNEVDDELRTIDSFLQSIQIEQPSANFTQKVMGNLHRASASAISLPSRNKILLLAGILTVIGIGLLLLYGGAFSNINSITFDQTLIPNEKLREHIPSIPFNGTIIINIVILMNLTLAFIILDRAVLKPWFHRRAKMNYE
jgi:hypothetical protein